MPFDAGIAARVVTTMLWRSFRDSPSHESFAAVYPDATWLGLDDLRARTVMIVVLSQHETYIPLEQLIVEMNTVNDTLNTTMPPYEGE